MTALTGTETLYVLGQNPAGVPAASEFQTTTSAIAALAAATVLPPITNTAITTVGNGTLTATGIVGGLITRSGPTLAFSDATDTAVAIVAALAAYVANESAVLRIKNTTAFAQTITAGSGVTLSGNVIIPANSVGEYLVTITSPTAVTILHIDTVARTTFNPEAITTLSTVGAGTITASGIAGRITNRTGSQSGTPFTDTTDTAANIVAATPNIHIGDTFEYTYQNTTNAVATLTGGTGVTVSGITAIGAGASARYLLSYTALNTFTMAGFGAGQATATSTQNTTFSGSTSGTTTLVASATAGSTIQTLPAVTGTIASTSGTNLFIADIKKCSAQTDATTTTLANVTGLTAQTLVAGATYRFRCVLPGTADGTGGIKYAFKYTTATLTSIEATGIGQTASATATQHTTTTTDATLLFDQAAAVILVFLEGTMVVNAGGTVALQMAEHAATSTASTYLGATMEFVRIA